MLDYISPFTFLFRDKTWLRKFLLASLLTYTLIGSTPVFGWIVEVVRGVARGDSASLPELDDWRQYWKTGAQFLAVNVLWLIPLALAALVLYLPLIFLNHIPDELLLAIWGGTLLLVLFFLLVYSIIYAFFMPPMLVHLAFTGQTWNSANPLALWRTVHPHFMEYLLVYLIVGLGLFNVIILLSAMTLFLLLPPLLVYLSLVAAHFAGQLLQRGKNLTNSSFTDLKNVIQVK